VQHTLEFGIAEDGDGNERAVLLASYNDMENVDFWEGLFLGTPFQDSILSEYVVTANMIEQLHLQWARTFDMAVSDIPVPIAAAAHVWDPEDVGSALHQWNPGYNWTQVALEVMKPTEDPVFISSSAFAPRFKPQEVEGALAMVDSVLDRYFL